MIETATGLVLRTRPLTETSLIVLWLTPTLGRISTVAKGARRSKSPFAGKLDLFYAADFSFNRSRRSELHTLREVNLRETHSALRQDLGRLQQACYCAALLEQTTETETPLPGLHELMLGLLAHLLARPVAPQTVFSFELRLLNELGLSPSLETSKLNLGTRKIVESLTGDAWTKLPQLRLSPAQIVELQQFLHGFLIYHLDRIPKGREAALGRSRSW